jgi:hypothetical protein
MRIVKIDNTLPINNLDLQMSSPKLDYRHGPLLSSTIRCIIAGSSNCGKTNVMLSLLEHPNGLRYENVYIYSKSLYQPKYEYLKELLEPIKGINYYPFSEGGNIIPPAKAKRNSIFIFDDVSCDKQNIIKAYFSMGRHSEVDCFYLTQTYTCIPKHLLRDNANMLVLFRQDDMNLQHVYRDHVNNDMKFDQFKNICSLCWGDKFGFLVIDKDSEMCAGRYRKGFDHYIYL